MTIFGKKVLQTKLNQILPTSQATKVYSKQRKNVRVLRVPDEYNTFRVCCSNIYLLQKC